MSLRDIREKLVSIYDETVAEDVIKRIEEKITSLKDEITFSIKNGFNEKDTILITYGDQFQDPGKKPLEVLEEFADTCIKGVVSSIHVLPFYPYSSDDGFSVEDYTEVNKSLGSWENIEALGENFRLMFDYVGNHISSKSRWFQKYLEEDEEYNNFFIEVPDDFDTSQVVRPRDTPLTHVFKGKSGEKRIWTTFGNDQVDLNYANPKVLLKMVDVLLFYIKKGATIIRLDAVQFTWKEDRTPCIHHPKTHLYVQLLHEIIHEAAPGVQIVTETAVPHTYNISYFGNGYNESQMVYNFTLPPLLLYSFAKEDTSYLHDWAKSLEHISSEATYFNILACHDGVGVNAIRGIIPEEEIVWLAKKVEERGGYVSNFEKPDKTVAPYELNISYINGLATVEEYENREWDKMATKMLNAFAIPFAMMGVPGIYVHSLLGSVNWREGAETSGHKRRINREKIELSTLRKELQDENSLRYKIFEGMKELIQTRREHEAFHPDSTQEILDFGKELFVIKREHRDTGQSIFSCHNFRNSSVTFDLDEIENKGKNLLEGKKLPGTGTIDGAGVSLPAYGYVWILQED